MVACAAEDPADQAQTNPGDKTPAVPAQPTDNDPAFTTSGLSAYYLVADGFVEGQNKLDLSIAAPTGTKRIDAWIDRAAHSTLTAGGSGFQGSIDVTALPPGDHELLLSADGKSTGFARLTFTRSKPMYVVVSTDWDSSDTEPFRYKLQEDLHAKHKELTISHLVGPYTFTDPKVTPARRKEIVAWLQGMAQTYGDEIGLHIHPYCNFVEAAGVTCRTLPSFSQAEPDTTGYTVTNESYTEAEFRTLLEKSLDLFAQNGLPKPTAYRAGGWTLAAHNLRDLEATGFLVDSSASNWARLEEWKTVAGSTIYQWNEQHWMNIGDQSQPYYPSRDNPAAPESPTVTVLELPDNGALVDYVTGKEMIGIFDENWSAGALTQSKVLSIGWHPVNFSSIYQARMNTIFDHVDQYLASTGKGPVVYANMTDMVKVFTPPS